MSDDKKHHGGLVINEEAFRQFVWSPPLSDEMRRMLAEARRPRPEELARIKAILGRLVKRHE